MVLKRNKPVITLIPKLLDQVRAAIRTRHYSIRTEEKYMNWIQEVKYYVSLNLFILFYIIIIINLINRFKNFISPPEKYILFHNKRHHNHQLNHRKFNYKIALAGFEDTKHE